jgi:hypothetical protein
MKQLGFLGNEEPEEYLDHEAVKLYRDVFKFCPKLGFRMDIVKTVKDFDLWKNVLTNWGYEKEGKWIKFNPLNVKGMVQEYERRATDERKRTYGSVSGERGSLRQGGETRIPQRRDGHLLRVQEGTRVHARSGGQTLDEVLTGALRANNRS